jgi:A/G-specific adenine glycosylase
MPWRGPIGLPRDPYTVLVSEAMLQQTQVSRVLERFPKFIARFPTVQSLAAADEREVLALWSGMGYYRRAKNLHAAARHIVDHFGGVVPRDVPELLALPGVGRYTAGAIASLAFGVAAPIVDGNVARVMLRVHGREVRADDRDSQAWLWVQAGLLARAGASLRPMGAAIANEAIMELGATVCLPAPATPRCGKCPLRGTCTARKDGTQDRIPLPKAAAARRTIYCATIVIRDRRGRYLLEQRGPDGMWAGLWQSPTIERTDRPPTRAEAARSVGLAAASLQPQSGFSHITTHRTVEFAVFAAAWPARAQLARGEWSSPDDLDARGLSSAQRRALSVCEDGLTPAIGSRRLQRR